MGVRRKMWRYIGFLGFRVRIYIIQSRVSILELRNMIWACIPKKLNARP